MAETGIKLRSPKWESVKFTAPTGGLTRGQMYKQGSLIGVIFETVAAASPDAVLCYKAEKIVVPKTAATGISFTVGAKVYYNDSAKKVTSTASANTLIGRCLVAAGATDTEVEITLNGDAAA